MSAIAAILRRDGRPTADAEAARMLGALAMYGPQRQVVWHDRTVALGHRLLAVVPEDRDDRQPLVGCGGLVRLVADARIDNRHDLAATLGLDAAGDGAAPDSRFVLAAYERWGAACCDHLVGSFAFAIWDERTRRLFCARDHLGDRPLFFHQAEDFIAVASMPKGLLALPDVPRALDETTMRVELAGLRCDRTASLFRGISRVPAGHALTVTAAGAELRRYWRADQAAPIRLNRDEDYVEAARALLEMAVACRLRRIGGIGAQLSGGLDSTAVAATAARRLAAGNERLAAFTAVPRAGYAQAVPEGRFADEWAHAQAVARMYPNIDHVAVPNPRRSPLAGLDKAVLAHDRGISNLCNWGWIQGIADAARARHVSVLLSAELGNVGLSRNGLSLLANSLATGRWGTLIGESLALVRGGSFGLRAILGMALGPFLPASAWRFRDWTRRRRHGPQPQFSALKPEHMDAASRAALGAGWQPDFRRWRPDRAGRARGLERIDNAEYRVGLLATHGIDQRDPMMDKRLIEFCLAIPEEQFLRRGTTRSLMRRIMHGALPDIVLHETRRGLQAADWHENLTMARDELAAELDRLEHSALASRLLDLPWLREMLDAWPSDGWHRDDVVANYRAALLRGISAGYFIRSIEGANR